jgi:hypothetical protein
MLMRPCRMIVSVALLVFTPAASGVARAQFSGYGFPTAGYGTGYGGYGGASSYGYGVRTGQVGNGYRSAGQFYPRPSYSTRSQTTISFGSLESAISLVPGWYSSTTTHRVRRRLRTTPSRVPPTAFKDDGTILWPSTVPDDPANKSLRRDAEAAVRGVVLEQKTTGHGSVRPVIDAKNKLSAFERKILPEVRAKNATDGDALETFFSDLDNALDTMTYTY